MDQSKLHKSPAGRSSNSQGAGQGGPAPWNSRNAGQGRPAPSPEKAHPSRTTQPLPGNLVHDERGNAVWDWLRQTGQFAIDSTSRLLKKLSVPDMSMEDTVEKEMRIKTTGKRTAGGGFDPYNRPARWTRPRKG